jgi:hypothetical protein
MTTYPTQIFFINNIPFFLTSGYEPETGEYAYTLWKNAQKYINAEKIEFSDSINAEKSRYILTQNH